MYSLFAIVLSSLVLVSCGAGVDDQPANGEGFKSIENEIKGKFGNDAHYTEVSIIHSEGIGNTVSVLVATDPESMKMEEWDLISGNWSQSSEVTIEIPEGSLAADYMFQLDGTVSLKKLGDLVEESKEKLTKEKSLENPRLHMAYVKYPDTGETAKAEYIVMLQPETGGTTFTFSYKLDGEFIEMGY